MTEKKENKRIQKITRGKERRRNGMKEEKRKDI